MPKPRLCDDHINVVDLVNAAARPNCLGVVLSLFKGGAIQGARGDYLVRYPRGKNEPPPGSFFSIDSKTGAWTLFAVEASGEDLVSLVARVLNLEERDAAQIIAREFLAKRPSSPVSRALPDPPWR